MSGAGTSTTSTTAAIVSTGPSTLSERSSNIIYSVLSESASESVPIVTSPVSSVIVTVPDIAPPTMSSDVSPLKPFSVQYSSPEPKSVHAMLYTTASPSAMDLEFGVTVYVGGTTAGGSGAGGWYASGTR